MFWLAELAIESACTARCCCVCSAFSFVDSSSTSASTRTPMVAVVRLHQRVDEVLLAVDLVLLAPSFVPESVALAITLSTAVRIFFQIGVARVPTRVEMSKFEIVTPRRC